MRREHFTLLRAPPPDGDCKVPYCSTLLYNLAMYPRDMNVRSDVLPSALFVSGS